ncbi:LysR family transcriptional regulator [Marivita sp. S6314]|uniref:LysR family transcriptional regulator n=1 Tax=Marivita sp. S6314 TaxID=2926406 RepID=UPI001FF4C643|nr:LysR family transcriptional regulator [Marivita sp. S6314]MCK0148618.1 LysR family transcriptional regulator [Marivita sp. S6314]
MHKLNWDDLRYVLAVAESGSVNAAAKALGVNHATVLRRITAFEEASGGPLFDRSPTGYKLRTDRAQVVEAARSAAQHVRKVEDLMRGTASGTGSVLRLTSTDSLCQTILARIFPSLSRRIAPDKLVYVQSNAHLDMAQLNADICVRPALTLPEDLQGQKIGQMGFAVYRKAGATGPAAWLGLDGMLSKSRPARWMDDKVDPADIASAADSFCALAQIAGAGSYRVILPCILGDGHPDLARDPSAPKVDFAVPIWVACYRDLASSHRITRCIDAVAKLVKPQAAALEGRG